MQPMNSSQRGRFSLLGVLAAAGLSCGLAVVRGLAGDGMLTLEALLADLAAEYATYTYVAGSTVGLGASLGWFAGGRAERFAKMSATDPLTQLANRRGLLASLQDELRRAARYHTPLALLILDLDFFKEVNDACGHEAGDAALRMVADSLRGTCRATDLPARFGGDEFAVVAPSTSADEALELASRIRHTLRRLSDANPHLGHLTLSIGIADVRLAGTCQGEALISAADMALYRAKSEGRDRACVARALTTPALPVAVA